MDPKGKGIVINDKENESFVNEPKDDKPTDSGSGHKRKDGKKKKTRRIKEIVYYDDYEQRKTVNSNFSFDYSRIPYSSNAHLLSIPLGKPPHFLNPRATRGKSQRSEGALDCPVCTGQCPVRQRL
jgi:hypothetical protein